ncbi:hypothetical protein [Nostoc sp. FACHB-888]|jgi:hypothetical protein|uniref:hypothetical protein n=1 Tax=Nostoc sp. FACHB-888 TaxID=2692842 RepID=UPI001689C173|nr:hypothetical protein [Nostoc sp. FACHB-888]MBD2249640.1 hypothetical protein [Nostoc sp. FACHB-888]
MVDTNTTSSSALYEKLASLCEQYPIEDVIEQLAGVCKEFGYTITAELLVDAVEEVPIESSQD